MHVKCPREILKNRIGQTLNMVVICQYYILMEHQILCYDFDYCPKHSCNASTAGPESIFYS